MTDVNKLPLLKTLQRRSWLWLRENEQFLDAEWLKKWSAWWLDRVGRGCVAIFPLALVLGLCVTTMTGWAGKPDQTQLQQAESVSVISTDWHLRDRHQRSVNNKAAFEQYHVLHAIVRVPD